MSGDNQNKKVQRNAVPASTCRTNRGRQGFTLVELLIASVVFSVVFGSAISALVWSVRWQKYNMSHQQLISQSSYAVEYMARAVRMAQKDDGTCTGVNGKNYLVSNANKKIGFRRYDGSCQSFYWDNASNQLMDYIDTNPSALPLTSDDYKITNLQFIVLGDNLLGDNKQPKVTILMEIQDKNLPDKPKIKIQTTVSQRNLDMQ